jgi:predicted amidohydrolase YtcJ
MRFFSANTLARLPLLAFVMQAACAGGTPNPPSRAATAASAEPRAADATQLYFNGKIYTASTDAKWKHVEAMAVRDGRILRVGTSADLRRELPGAHPIDLHGRTVVPGLNDAHYHHSPDPKAVVLQWPPPEEPTVVQVRDAIAAAAKKDPATWIVVEAGIQVLADPQFDRAFLDRISATNPIFVRAWYGHGHVLSSKALSTLAIGDDIADPVGGRFGRTKDGHLDGRAFEYAEWITGPRLAGHASDADISRGQAEVFGEALHFGVTTLQNMSWTPADRYLRIAAANKKAPRVRWINWPKTPDDVVLPSRTSVEGSTVSVSGIKWVLDGTPFEHGAAMSFPYADGSPAARPNFSQEAVARFFEQARAGHQPILLHAAGNVPIQQAFAALERIPEAERAALRVRIEHGDWVSSEDEARLKRWSMVVVLNPSHLTLGGLFDARFGPQRKAMRVASLVHSGVHVAIGSDGPLNPFLNMMFAVSNPYRPEEALTREEAIDAYTREAAYAELAEADKGTLEPGKVADFAVLSQDVFTCPVPALPGTSSVLTVVGGRVLAGAEDRL